MNTSSLYLQLHVCISERHTNESFPNMSTSRPGFDRGAIVAWRKGKIKRESEGGERGKARER